MSEPPSFIKDNPWTDILSKRGKEGETLYLPAPPPSDSATAPKNHAQIMPNAATRRKGTRSQIQKRRNLVLRLYSIGLDNDQIQEALAGQGVLVATRTIRHDLAVLKKQLETLDRKQLGYTLGLSFAELRELWREGWSTYLNPDPDVGFLKIQSLRELRNLHRAKTWLTGLDPRLGISTEILAFSTPFVNGVKITTSAAFDDNVRDGGIEYAAKCQVPAGTDD